MELPGILKQIFTADRQGYIELCPEEYNMENLSDLIEDALAACEELTLDSASIKAIGISKG